MQKLKITVMGLLLSVLSLCTLSPLALAGEDDGSQPLISGLPKLASTFRPEVKQIVTFGDSFTAGATFKRSSDFKPALGSQVIIPCRNDYLNWPHQLAAVTGKTLGDWSCNGTGAYPIVQLEYYVESAIQHGDVGLGTENIIFMYGGMDALTWEAVGEDLLNVSLPADLGMQFQNMMQRIAQRIAYVAPDATFVMSGYPEMTDGNKVCTANFLGHGVGVTISQASTVLPALSNEQKQAALSNNGLFIDMETLTRGHGPCSGPDSERWVAGYVDTSRHEMPAHPTDAGHWAMGAIMAQQLYGDGESTSAEASPSED